SRPNEIQVSGTQWPARVVVNIQRRFDQPRPRNAGLSTRFIASSQSRNRWPSAGQKTANVTRAITSGQAQGQRAGVAIGTAAGAGAWAAGAGGAARARARRAVRARALIGRAPAPDRPRARSGDVSPVGLRQQRWGAARLADEARRERVATHQP